MCTVCGTVWAEHATMCCWQLDPEMIEDNLEGEKLEEHIQRLMEQQMAL